MSMKLLKTKVDSLYRKLEAGENGGFFTAHLEYNVKDAKGTFEYKGPKIPKEMWQQILSFFKWTNDTYHSEAQVRLFVSPKNGTWKAWAFPQEGDTGLSSKEIQNDDFKSQRAALFEKDEDWIAWGTVHHHCNISAFQSHTDEQDEQDQGGLHITVGDLGSAHYSIHCRLYHQNDLWEPDMSVFWDIGDVLNGLPPSVAALLPNNAPDAIARQLMCIPSDVAFPEQWRKNYIVKPKVVYEPKGLVENRDTPYFSNDYHDNFVEHKMRAQKAREALDDMLSTYSLYEMTEAELFQILQELMKEPVASVVAACAINECEPEDVFDALKEKLEKETNGSSIADQMD